MVFFILYINFMCTRNWNDVLDNGNINCFDGNLLSQLYPYKETKLH